MRYLIVIVACIFSSISLAFEKGTGAWFYGTNSSWFDDIKTHNQSVIKEKQLKYFFPKVYSINFLKDQAIKIDYDNKITRYYKKETKSTVFPIVRGQTTHFNHWEHEQYLKAADLLAGVILNDKYADGIQLDLEPFHISHMPFYQALARKLFPQGKKIALFLRSEELNDDIFRLLKHNGFVILYGYDLSQPGEMMPIPPSQYRHRLSKAIAHLDRKAKQYDIQYMVGLPAVATMKEWQKKNINGKIINNRYNFLDYFQEGVNEVMQTQSKYLIGISLFAFVEKTNGQNYFPLIITSKHWRILNIEYHK